MDKSMILSLFAGLLAIVCILYISVSLKKILKMRKLVINHPPPFGMTQEQFIANKRKQKLWLVASFLLGILLTGGAVFYLGGGHKDYDVVPERKAEELKMMHGIFFSNVSGGGRAPYHEFGLRNEKTGKVIFKALTELCGDSESLSLYALSPANIWFADGPPPYVWMYQLEVNGRLICDIDTANMRAKVRNDGLYVNYLWATSIFLFLFSQLLVALLRSYIKEVYGKDFI